MRAMTAQQLVEHGLCDPVRVFVKNEPHPKSKIAQNRFRIISSVSIVDYCIESWLSDAQNQEEISVWDSIPAKPGMGLDDMSLRTLFDEAAPHILAGRCMSTDMTGWDFSVKWWELENEAYYRARQFSDLDAVEPHFRNSYHNIMLGRYICAALVVRVLSNGEMWAQAVAGIMISGRKNTSSDNSHIRVNLVKKRDPHAFVMAMGDDCVEEYFDGFEQYYTNLGHVVKSTDTRIYSAKNIEEVEFQFCSTRIRYDQDKQMVVGEPVNWARIFYRLLDKPANPENLDQFCNDMRHSPQLKRCLDTLEAVGWVAAKFSKQGAFSMPAHMKVRGKGKMIAIAVPAKKKINALLGKKVVKKKGAVKIGAKKSGALSTAAVMHDLQHNAEAFVESVKRPFSVRGMRLPEPSPMASVTGSFTVRFNANTVVDAGLSAAFIGIMAWPNFVNPGAAGGPIWLLSASASGALTWTTQAFPNQSAFVTNFNVIRPISMGIRIINTAAALNRAGVGYVTTTQTAAPPATTAALTVLTTSEETKEFDLSKMHIFGEEFVWTPISYQPSNQVQLNGSTPAANLYTYFTPSATGLVLNDNKCLFWLSCGVANACNITCEMVVNYEAIPFPQTQPLFEPKVVVGAADDISVALEKKGVQGQNTVTDSSFFNAAVDVAGDALEAGLRKGGGVKGVLKAVLPQVPSLIKRFGAWAGSLFSASDYDNHVLATAYGAHHMSPAHNKQHLGLTRDEFLRILAEEGIGVLILPPTTAKDEEKDDAPPPSLQSTSASALMEVRGAASAPPSGVASAARVDKAAYVMVRRPA